MRFKIFLLSHLILLALLTINFPIFAANEDFSKISKAVQTFQVEPFSGAGATSIPIIVPPGRRGIQPIININYSSTAGNGWLGVGWGLDFGYIERVTNKGVPKYDSTDKFRISFMGINSELETATQLPNEYYPISTSYFIKLFFRDSYWEAVDKEGKRYIFGQTDDSRIDSSLGTFRWALCKVIDSTGNYLTIQYSKDGQQIYPFLIAYTGNEANDFSPTHSVRFILEDRQDTSSSYKSGSEILTAKRLRELKTYVGDSLVNSYLFEYLYSRKSGRSLLNRFTFFGADNTTNLPPSVLTYSDQDTYLYSTQNSGPSAGNKLWHIRKGDFFGISDVSGALSPKSTKPSWRYAEGIQKNGAYWSIDENGKIKVNLGEKFAFHAWTYLYVAIAKTISISPLGQGNFSFWLNSDYSAPVDPAVIPLKEGVNLFEVAGYNLEGALNFDLNSPLADNVLRMHSNQLPIPQLCGDFNADGLSDLATYYASNGLIKVSLSNGNAFSPAEFWPVVPGIGFPKYIAGPRLSLLLGNFNEDFATDIIAANSHGQAELILADDKAFLDQGGVGIIFSVQGTPFAADFNGDGKTDIGLQAEKTSDILIGVNRIDGSSTWLSGFSGKLLIGDFNGDGLMDLAAYDEAAQKISVALNRGNSFTRPVDWLSNFNPPLPPIAADANGDSLTDICYYDKANGRIMFLASSGKEFIAARTCVSGLTIQDPDLILQTGDFNGDGVTDYFLFNPFTQNAETAYSQQVFTDLLTKVENGIGGEIEISYDGSGNYDNTVANELRQIGEYRYLRSEGFPFSIPVTKELKISDGMGNSFSTFYSYQGGFFDINDREFRGFRSIVKVDEQGNKTQLFFKQDDIFKGKLYREESRDSSGRLLLKIEREWWSEPISNGCYYPTLGKFVYLREETRFTYDDSGGYKKSFVRYEYDHSVNQECISGDLTMLTKGGDDTAAHETVIQYVRQRGQGILSRPSYIYTRISKEMWIIQDKKQFFYDNNTDPNAIPTKGLLTKEKSWLYANYFDPNNNEPNVLASYTYDDFGNPLSVTDPEGRTTTTTFDTTFQQFPTQITNPLGHITQNTFDPRSGKALTSTDANGQFTTYIYDELFRLSKVIGPKDTLENPAEIYEYDLTSLPTKITRHYKTDYPSTYATEYLFYDGLGRLIETKIPAEDDPLSGEERQIVKGAVLFDKNGRIKTKFNDYFVPLSNAFSPFDSSIPKTTFEYDALGRVLKTTNPDLSLRTIQYSGWTKTTTDENGNKVVTHYDALERAVKCEEFNGNQTYITQYKYDQLTVAPEDNYKRYKTLKIIDNSNNQIKIFYDAVGNRVKMSDPDMGTWYWTYDKVGSLKTQRNARGETITFNYDALARVTQKTYPDGRYIRYVYDDSQKSYCLGRLSYVSDLSGRTDYYYDSLGRKIKTKRTIDGQEYSLEQDYNPQGQPLSLRYPDNKLVYFLYNQAGYIERISGDSLYVSNADYAATGQLSRIDYGNLAYSEYLYDPATTRLNNLKTNNGLLQDLNYQYDNTGNISRITDYRNNLTQDFTYDSLKRLIRAVGAYGSLSYEYDSLGNLIYKEGVTYGYGEAGATPHSVTSGSDGFTATYDANGNMASRNDAVLTYDYDNRLIRFESTFSQQPVTLELRLSAGWNFITFPFTGENNISSVLSSIAGRYTQVSRYNPTTNKFEHYVPGQADYSQFNTLETGKGYQIYVTADCVLSLTGSLPSASYNISLLKGWQMLGYPSKNRVQVSYALSNLAKGVNYDRICRYERSTSSFVNLTATDCLEPGEAYFIRLLKASTWTVLPKQETTQFAYDYLGNRVKKIVSGITTVYIDKFFEQTGSLTTKHIFFGNNRIASISLSSGREGQGEGAISYYHPDHLGSTSVITNSSGQLAQRYEYTPYGSLAVNTVIASPVSSVIASPEGAKQSPVSHLFTGKELDATGLYYYGARYYNPQIGRFISPDSINQDLFDPQNLNPYTYCRNNPLNLIDPTGESWSDSWNSFNSWVDNTLSDFKSTGFKQGFGQSIYKGIIGASAGTLAIYSISLLTPPTAFISTLVYGGAILGGAGIGLSGGGLITKKSITGRDLSQYELGEYAGSFALGSALLGLGAWETLSIKTPHGRAFQSYSKGALSLRQNVTSRYLYRSGELGVPKVNEGQFWAPQNPLTTPNYAQEYGITSSKINFVIGGKLKSDASFITRNAPSFGSNPGGASEVVTNPNSVELDFFYMSD